MRLISVTARLAGVLLLSLAGSACTPSGVEPLPAPEIGKGFQIKTQATAIPAGKENQDCYFFRVPAAAAEGGDVWVKRILMRQRPGTHHMNIFRVKTVVNLKGEDGEVVRGTDDAKNPCWVSSNWADWPLVVNTQTSNPGKSDTAFDLPEGVAHRFAPGELLMLQSHYVNASTQMTPDVGEVWVNFETLPKAEVRAELGTLFATNQNLNICPGQQRSYEKVCRTPRPVTVVGANGHFHSRGTRFAMYTWDETNGKGQQFYESTTWDDPPMATGLSVALPQNAGIVYRCEFNAPADSCGDPNKGCCFTFGGQVETSEHCNAFVYYYPRIDTDLPCF
jgi:hypothetical protein